MISDHPEKKVTRVLKLKSFMIDEVRYLFDRSGVASNLSGRHSTIHMGAAGYPC